MGRENMLRSLAYYTRDMVLMWRESLQVKRNPMQIQLRGSQEQDPINSNRYEI